MKKLVLIVDNNSADRYILLNLFKDKGYEVIEADNGSEALKLARQNLPQLVISDLLQPGMGVFTLLKDWKKDDLLCEVPFVLYTDSFAETQAEKLALDMGADLFITKPEDPEIIMACIAGLFALQPGPTQKKNTRKPQIKGEELLNEYNKVLIHKLEQKTLQFEDAITRLNHEVEQRCFVEAELTKNKNELDQYLENDISAHFVSTPEGEILNCNKAFLKMFGFTGKIQARHFSVKSLYRIPAERIAMLQKISETGSIENHEVEFITLHGRIFHTIVNSTGIFKDNQLVQIIGYIVDITDLKKAEYELRMSIEKAEESEKKYRELVENSPDAIVIYVEDEIVYANKESLSLMAATSADELIGKPVLRFVHPDSRASFTERMKVAAKGGKVLPIAEERFLRLDGSKVHVEVKAIKISMNNKPAVQLVIRDIGEKKLAEDSLRMSEERYRAVVDNGFEGIIIIDFEGKILFANQSLIKTFEYETLEQIVGLNVFQFIAPESIPLAIDDLTKMAQGLVLDVQNYSGITSKGNKIWFESIGKIIDYDRVKADIISVRDITAKKKAEEKFIENEKKFRAITQSANDAILVTDSKGNVVFSNPKALEIFGYNESEFTNEAFEMIMPAQFREAHNRNFELFVSGKSEYYTGKTREFSALRKNGSEFPMEISLSTWETSSGVFVAANIRDITERKIAETELIKAKERAEESDRLKSAFLANISHEIRTPMNGILGFSELLSMPDLTGEQQKEYVQIIQKSGDRMLNIINEIVDISKIESGQMQISIKETDLNDQIDFIYNFFKPQAESKGIKIVCKNGIGAKECIIKTDREKFFAILTNLVKNAIKYTDRGQIELGYTVVEKPNTPALLEFYVKDTGIGIPPKRHAAVFDRFIQADIDDKRAFQGAGLGLAIAKAYVEMLGGKIWVVSEEGKGSAFHFTILYNPVLKSKPGEKKIVTDDEINPLVRKIKVLIVEDDETSEALLSVAINKYCSEILTAETGNKAVEACRNHNDIDLILMDIKMPDLDGHEATRQIREFNKDVIIIAQTAFGLAGDRDKALKAGCNEYISKPVNLILFDFLVQKYFA